MPDPSQRKERDCAQQRAIEKYYKCPDERNPQKVYPKLIKESDVLRDIMNTKNYVRILTQIDLNQFIMMQYYIYCDEDIWVSGEALIFNANPDKKIMMKIKTAPIMVRNVRFPVLETLSFCAMILKLP